LGPTQSGKTSSLAVPAILRWEGPVFATSVKTDLIDHTVHQRQDIGPVEVFDPAGATAHGSTAWVAPPGVADVAGSPAHRRRAVRRCQGFGREHDRR
jgi:type IV secretory pathway TraG/TraD family ATPase VirD4